MISAIAARKAAKAASTNPSWSTSETSAEVDATPIFPGPNASVGIAGAQVINKRKGVQDETTPRKRRRPTPDIDNATPHLVTASEDSSVQHPQPFEAALASNVGRAYSPGRLVAEESDLESRGSSPEGSVFNPLPAPVSPGPLRSTYVRRSSNNFFQLLPEDHGIFGLDSSPAVLVSLQPDDSIAFTGTVRVEVCRGRINILGCTLSAAPTQHPVFASRTHAIPVISAAPSVKDDPSLELPRHLAQKSDATATLVILQELHTGVEGLGKVCSAFEGMFDGEGGNDSDWGLAGFHPISSESSRLQPFVLPPSWNRALSSVSPSAPRPTVDQNVFLVKGAKNTGKSTFARTLANQLTTLYQRTAFLECDLGQSEFTPSGMVSLHILTQPVFGPPFTHLFRPFRAHYIGSPSPRSDPALYLASIDALVQTYKLELQYSPLGDPNPDTRRSDTVPLVINTMGWTKGLGASLARKIEEISSPTHIFEVEQPADRDWFSVQPLDPLGVRQDPYGVSSSKAPVVHILTPVDPPIQSSRYNAALLRTISTLSYFFMTNASDSPVSGQWSTASPLSAMAPWEVDWSAAFDQIIITGPSSEDIVDEEVGTVLNGALVALVAAEETVKSRPTSDHRPEVLLLPYVQGALPPSPFTSNCLGLALVRAVQPGQHTFHILTHLPGSSLASCRVLIKGEQELPVWGFLDHREAGDVKTGPGVEWPQLPFLEWGAGQGIGGEKRRTRRNLMRKNQGRLR